MARLFSLIHTWPRVTLFFVVQMVFWLTWSGGADPDALFSVSNFLSVFLSFFSVLILYSSVGRLLSNRFKIFDTSSNSQTLQTSLGMIFCLYSISLLGLIGGLGIFATITVLVLTCVASILADRACRSRQDSDSLGVIIKKYISDNWLILIVAITSVAFTLLPSDFSDPLYYHLRAPQQWIEQGKISFDRSNPLFFLAGAWESNYLIAMLFLPSNVGFGLIEMQLLSQGLHFFTAFFLAAGVLREVGKRLFNFDRQSSMFAFLFIALSASFWESAVIAKNDWGILFLSAYSLLCLIEYLQKSERRYLVLFAGVLGLVSVSKFTVAVPLVLVALGIFLQKRNILQIKKNQLGIVLLAGVIGMAPILLRNILYIGTPLFPVGAEKVLSGTDILLFDAFRSYPGEHSLSAYLEHLLDLLLMIPVAIFAVFVGKEFWKRNQIIFLLLFLSFTIHILFVDLVLNWRLIGIGIAFLVYFGTAGILNLCQMARFPNESKFFVLFSVLIVTVVFSGTPQKFTRRLELIENPSKLIRKHKAGDSMAWARMKQKHTSTIFFSGNNLLYYLPGFNTVTIETNPIIDRALAQLNSGEAMIKRMNELGADYFVETYGPVPWGRSAKFLNPIMNRCRECIVFAGITSRVVDLAKLKQFIEDESYVAKPFHDRGQILPKQK